ncbi:MAG: response regulator transcription factor [Candidatus Binatia bacterium]
MGISDQGEERCSDSGSSSGANQERRTAFVLAALFASVAALAGFDLLGDLKQGIDAGHALAEGLVVAVGLTGFGWMLLRLQRLARQASRLGEAARELAADLAASRLEAERWRRDTGDLIAGLGAAIDRQLLRWELTAAEQEVALLLLKGLSHKEIAGMRGTGEATVRQQSRAIYRKAGLAGRHDLAAFFLEDLLDPRAPSRAGASSVADVDTR